MYQAWRELETFIAQLTSRIRPLTSRQNKINTGWITKRKIRKAILIAPSKMPASQPVIPGQILGQATHSHPGLGTHITGSSIASSLAGSTNSHSGTKSVERPGKRPVIPVLNAIILGRITRLRHREAHLAICVVDSIPVAESFAGIIRTQDIRATEKDKIRMADSFCVGDVVRAAVISIGDERNYYCSTARNELGVVMAISEGGEALSAMSWREMSDASGRVEMRKVAKPDR